jgi:hypothetical protein
MMSFESPSHSSRRGKFANLVLVVAAVWMASILGEVMAKQEPGLPVCSGRRLNQQGRCSPDRTCPQSLPACDAWISTFETPLCTGANPLPGDNCIIDPNNQKLCGTRGRCRLDGEGNCVQFDQAAIQTNPVRDGGGCTIQP